MTNDEESIYMEVPHRFKSDPLSDRGRVLREL